MFIYQGDELERRENSGLFWVFLSFKLGVGLACQNLKTDSRMRSIADLPLFCAHSRAIQLQVLPSNVSRGR